tara:strand:- start:935 stop:1534 length:600 start_codon:yes stop_codon:yes gene_type:complete
MIYPKYAIYDVYSNMNGLKNEMLSKDVYLDTVATLIREQPKEIIALLRQSDVNVPRNPTKRQITNLLVKNLYISPQLRRNLSELIVYTRIKPAHLKFVDGPSAGETLTNTAGNVGQGVQGGAAAGGPIGAIIGAVVGLTESIFDYSGAKKEAETESERTRLTLFTKIVDGKRKINPIPFIIIGVVLILGGVIIVYALKS